MKGITPYTLEVTQPPASAQVTASALWPAMVIAARALREKVTTRVAPLVWNFSSSAKLGTSMRQALSPPFAVTPAYPMFLALGSPVQATILRLSRSNQLLDTIPCDAGKLPVEIVAWPTQVSVVA